MSPRRPRRRQHGFTLVEIMVSLVISSLLIGMILSVFSRMSMAYRGQQGVAELQQILAAGQSMIERDLRQAGYQIPDGFFMSYDGMLHQPVEIENDPNGFGPDQLRIYYADASAQARIETGGTGFTSIVPDAPAFTSITVDDASDFVNGDVVVIVRNTGLASTDLRYYACVVQIETITGNVMNLDGAGRWGTAENNQCDGVRSSSIADANPMVYRFRMRGYRIDPDRRELAVLQMSPSAGFDDDWQDLAVGFTDLQIASRWDDSQHAALQLVDTVDIDTDPFRDWFSDATQQSRTYPLSPTGSPYIQSNYELKRSRLIGLRVTLVVRTHSRIDTVPSQRTPKLTDDARPGNNDLGDRDEVQLEGVADAARPLELRGDHVYRYATVGTDLRNLGVAVEESTP